MSQEEQLGLFSPDEIVQDIKTRGIKTQDTKTQDTKTQYIKAINVKNLAGYVDIGWGIVHNISSNKAKAFPFNYIEPGRFIGTDFLLIDSEVCTGKSIETYKKGRGVYLYSQESAAKVWNFYLDKKRVEAMLSGIEEFEGIPILRCRVLTSPEGLKGGEEFTINGWMLKAIYIVSRPVKIFKLSGCHVCLLTNLQEPVALLASRRNS